MTRGTDQDYQPFKEKLSD